jgi:UPF0755 protein
LIKRLIVVLLIALLVMGGELFWYARTPLPLKSLPIEFTLVPGSSLTAVAGQLRQAGVIEDAWKFRFLARLSGNAARIKAGHYTLTSPTTPYELLRKLILGEVSLREIVFIEGWTFQQMRAALNTHPAIRHDTTNMTEGQILTVLHIPEAHAEGLFFPAKYYIDPGNSDISILRRANATMQMHLAKEWAARQPGLLYSNAYQALTMASIIEKETGLASERPLIAAVFINRLRKGMRLQTDPSVIYGMGSAFDGNLHKRDLLADTPYNTYTRAGLPPSPIAMPGLDSIHAALHPAISPDLYFVAKGDGSHYFSDNLEAHNRAVVRYQKNGH